MRDKIKQIIAEFELFIITSDLIYYDLDYKRKDMLLAPLKECVELLKQVENTLEEHYEWALKELDRLNQND